MLLTKCPGQDMRYWNPEDIRDIKCPYCENPMEFWKTDIRLRCKGCGRVVVNPNFNLGCAAWCSYAEQCLGDAARGIGQPDSIRKKLEDYGLGLLKAGAGKEYREKLEAGEELSTREGAEFLTVAVATIFKLIRDNLKPAEAEKRLRELKTRAGIPFLVAQEAREILQDLEKGEARTPHARVVHQLFKETVPQGQGGGKDMGKKTKREIIKIDQDLCDGCGLCVPACAEGAIQIIDGKARLVSEIYCDGLGDCLGECPQGAISIEVREAEAFDQEAVDKYLETLGKGEGSPDEKVECQACSALSGEINRDELDQPEAGEVTGELESRLGNWPVKIKLVSPQAPFLKKGQLVIAADCAPFAYASFHRRFLPGGALLIGCPKLDDTSLYLEKLTEIFKNHSYEKVTVVNIEIPCCSGLVKLVRKALERAGSPARLETISISIEGKI